MENASKALIMAGSVLLAIMVIGLLIFGYNKMSNLEQVKENSKEVDKLAEYMARFEQFNRGKDNPLYGSELLSLANLQEDYNESDARADIGYDKIEIKVKINKELKVSDTGMNPKYDLKANEYDIGNIINWKKDLEKEIEKYEKPKSNYYNKSVKYYSTKSYRDIALAFMDKIESALKDKVKEEFGENVEYSGIPSTWGNDILSDFLAEHPKTATLIQEINEYNNLKTTLYNEFRTGKRFYCENVEYSKLNGRIKEMYFVEI